MRNHRNITRKAFQRNGSSRHSDAGANERMSTLLRSEKWCRPTRFHFRRKLQGLWDKHFQSSWDQLVGSDWFVEYLRNVYGEEVAFIFAYTVSFSVCDSRNQLRALRPGHPHTRAASLPPPLRCLGAALAKLAACLPALPCCGRRGRGGGAGGGGCLAGGRRAAPGTLVNL